MSLEEPNNFAEWRRTLELEIKKLKEEVEKLKLEKVNREPYRWLQHRVGQIQRRLDRYNLL